MKGSDFLTVSPIITESHSRDLQDIIYSKIIFELDNLNIGKVENILLSCQTISNERVKYFETKFPHSRVGYIVSQPLQNICPVSLTGMIYLNLLYLFRWHGKY